MICRWPLRQAGSARLGAARRRDGRSIAEAGALGKGSFAAGTWRRATPPASAGGMKTLMRTGRPGVQTRVRVAGLRVL